LVKVKVKVVVPFRGTVAAPNALAIIGGARTVRATVLLVAPVPVSFALTGPLVLFRTPAAAPVTVTLIVQLPPAAIDPPVSVIVLPPLVVRVPPPHVAELPLATVRPAGKTSVNVTPVIPSEALVLVMVNVRLVVPPSGIVAAPKALLIVGGVATVSVAVLLPIPVPPLVDVTAPVVLFLTPPVAPVTVTLNVQVPPAAMVAPDSVIVLGFVVVSVPPHGVELPVATVNPAGRLSVNPTPVNPTVEFGFVIVKLRLVVPPTGIFAAPNDLAIVGGASTVIEAVAVVVPVPPSLEVTVLLVLFLTPAVVAVKSTFTVQVPPPAATIPPLNVREVSPAFGANVPPHPVLAFGVLATANPDGSASVNPTPVRGVVELLLVIVNVRVVVPPSGIVGAANDFDMLAGPTTVIMAVLLVAPGPLSFELMAPVVFICTPAAVPVTVTMNEQVPLAASVPPVNEIIPGAVVVTVPPQVARVPLGTDSPAGSMSVKLIPDSDWLVFGLVIVNIKLVVPPTGMLASPNPLVSVGAAATLIETVAVLVQPPGLLSTYLNVSTPVKLVAGV
jgi:hypothetical protein